MRKKAIKFAHVIVGHIVDSMEYIGKNSSIEILNFYYFEHADDTDVKAIYDVDN